MSWRSLGFQLLTSGGSVAWLKSSPVGGQDKLSVRKAVVEKMAVTEKDLKLSLQERSLDNFRFQYPVELTHVGPSRTGHKGGHSILLPVPTWLSVFIPCWKLRFFA